MAKLSRVAFVSFGTFSAKILWLFKEKRETKNNRVCHERK